MGVQKTHLKKGDEVLVLSGKDKGRKGKILQVLPGEGKVVVEGINISKKHCRPSKVNPQGGVLEKASGMPFSKVMIICAGCGQPTRVNRQRAQDGKLVRICKNCNRVID